MLSNVVEAVFIPPTRPPTYREKLRSVLMNPWEPLQADTSVLWPVLYL